MGFENIEVKVMVVLVSKYQGGDLEFLLPEIPELYDDRAGDYIASVSFDDIEKEIAVFKDNGWTDLEVREMYQDVCPPIDGGHRCKDTELKRPVEVTVTIKKYHFGQEAKV